MIAAYELHFGQPWWLLLALLAPPMIWLGWRNLGSLGTARRWLAVVLRVLVVALLVAMLAHPTLTRKEEKVTVVAVLDRSQSIPQELQASAAAFMDQALTRKPDGDQIAVIDVAEDARIAMLPSGTTKIDPRATGFTGEQSKLFAGLQMAMAIAPPETATRILLASDANETVGDLLEVARIAAANHIPIDVLPLPYNYAHEVVFKRLVSPRAARSGQTVQLRFVLSSTGPAAGQLALSVNGTPADLDPGSSRMTVSVELQAGTNVKVVSIPVGSSGVQEYEATFIPDAEPGKAPQDTLMPNNHASSVTFVAGPGHVLVVDPAGGEKSKPIIAALQAANIDARAGDMSAFPTRLFELMDVDAIMTLDVPNHMFTHEQEEMLCRYVTDLGGGLVMVGGPDSYGAGGWIGSEVAKILPVDPDPPQKKELPKGALVMVMHACEMPDGNYWGKEVAIAAASTLSRLDLVGVVDYGWNNGDKHWVYPLGLVGNRSAVTSAIKQMQMGDMPDFGAPLQAAYDALKGSDAGQKHIIIISDGDPQVPNPALVAKLREARIKVSGVAVSPHDGPGSTPQYKAFVQDTGGNFYDVTDPKKLPQIFIKEAQIVQRALINEEPFTPKLIDPMHEVIRGLGALPNLNGYVLTGPKGGLSQVILTSPKKDPILATGQAGLGRVVAFTSSADSQWAKDWLAWGGFGKFWEQTVRWVGRSTQAADCEVVCDLDGRTVTVTAEAVDKAGEFVQFANIAGQVISPEMGTRELPLTQVGPGQYRGTFQTDKTGSYLVNLRYKRAGAEGGVGTVQSVVIQPHAPEYRDLTDNSALLMEVARITGGRVLEPEPDKADLFSHAGLVFPQTPQPVIATLMLIWLALFWLDVACRRVVVDFVGIGRKIAAFIRQARPGKVNDQTLDQLKNRREQVREQLAVKAKEKRDANASRKYEPGQAGATGGQSASLPMADVDKPAPPPRKPAGIPAPSAGAAAGSDESHLSRLLKAKRTAQDRIEQTRKEKEQ